MKITDVEALHLRIPGVQEIADGTQDVLIVRVHADNGLVGIGECDLKLLVRFSSWGASGKPDPSRYERPSALREKRSSPTLWGPNQP